MKKLFFSIILFSLPLFATNYYVKSSGNDASAGTSDGTAWATVFRVGRTAYVAGDSILFNKGDIFEGSLLDTLTSSTTVPIVVGSYGTGAKPIIRGDMYGRSWTPVTGRAGVYKMYLGGYSEVLHGYWQYYSGGWNNITTTSYRGSNSATWEAFYDSLGADELGMSVGRDTIFIHTHGSVTIDVSTSDSRDSLRVYREGSRIMSALSNNYIVRDLEFKYAMMGFYSYGDSALIRNLTATTNLGGGIRFQDNSTKGLMDSCRVDSTGDSGIYLVTANNCTVRRNLVINVLQTVDGIDAGGIDNSAVGMLGNYNGSQSNGGNVVEYNTFHNIRLAFIDFFYNYRDTVRYNEGHNANTACSIGGKDCIAYGNTFVGKTTGMTLGNMSCDSGTVTFRDNTCDSVTTYAFYSQDDGGEIYIRNNTVTLAPNANQKFWDSGYNLTGSNYVTNMHIDSNHYFGIGGRFIHKDTIYYTLENARLHTSYDSDGLTWDANSTLNDTTVANADTIYFYYTTNDTVNIYGINDTLQVLVTDTAGVPISGVAVTFARTTAPTGAIGQAITTTLDTTNASGLAETILTLGSKAGNYVVTATSTGLGGSPVTITTRAYRSSNRLIKR